VVDAALRDHVRELFGRVVYSHKTHEKDRERFTFFATVSKGVNVALSALTFGGVAAALQTQTHEALLIGVAFATVNAAFALVQLSFDPNRQAGLHREAAKQLLVVRDDYLTLLADIASGAASAAEVRLRRDALQAEAQEVFASAPDTTSAGFRRARKALKAQEEMTFSSAEIDAFLPVALRLDRQGLR
jgi:hypothetical protein